MISSYNERRQYRAWHMLIGFATPPQMALFFTIHSNFFIHFFIVRLCLFPETSNYVITRKLGSSKMGGGGRGQGLRRRRKGVTLRDAQASLRYAPAAPPPPPSPSPADARHCIIWGSGAHARRRGGGGGAEVRRGGYFYWWY